MALVGEIAVIVGMGGSSPARSGAPHLHAEWVREAACIQL